MSTSTSRVFGFLKQIVFETPAKEIQKKEKTESTLHSDSVTQTIASELISQIGSSPSYSSSSTSSYSSSSTTSSRRLSRTTLTPKEIDVLFATKNPKVILKKLNSMGYPDLGECQCI